MVGNLFLLQEDGFLVRWRGIVRPKIKYVNQEPEKKTYIHKLSLSAEKPVAPQPPHESQSGSEVTWLRLFSPNSS